MKISIEGLIGAGKSTASAILADFLGAHYQREPDEKNDDVNGVNPYLADYYRDPQRHAFAMQIHLMTLRARQARDAEHRSARGAVVVSDRSLPGDLAFARVQLARGIMTRREYDTYCRAYQLNLDRACYPDLVLFLDTPPQKCLERVARRMGTETGRTCESGIPLDYMTDLARELDWVLDEISAQGVYVKRVSWGEDADPRSLRRQVKQLATFVDLYHGTHSRSRIYHVVT